MWNPIRRYAWGSTDAIPDLLGVAPDGRPQAELWLGSYEAESSSVRIGGRWRDLSALLVERGEPRLPFMAKVIAIGAPLSLQIHPDSEAGAKTEMLYAWQPCRVLCGFRDVAGVRGLLADLRAASPDGPVRSMADRLLGLAVTQESLRDCLAALLRTTSVSLVAEVCERLRRSSRWTAVVAAIETLAARHPGEPAALAPLLLEVVDLPTGEAIICRPGQPHTYLAGLGFEVQTSSDAVLRAGLTTKPTDVDGFVAGLTTRPGSGRVGARVVGSERLFAPVGAGFALGVVGDVPDDPIEPMSDVEGAQILFCVEGAYTVYDGTTELELRNGESAFVPGPRPALRIRGKGCLFRVSTGREG